MSNGEQTEGRMQKKLNVERKKKLNVEHRTSNKDVAAQLDFILADTISSRLNIEYWNDYRSPPWHNRYAPQFHFALIRSAKATKKYTCSFRIKEFHFIQSDI
jgi:hypothetical protein